MEGLELELTVPASREHRIWDKEQELFFVVTVTLRGSKVEKWIEKVKRDYLDAAPIKCVGLDCEFTNPREGNQRAAVLQLSVARETLVFQIVWATEVPQMLKEFLQDNTIRFCGAAINNDVRLLRPYGIEIPSVYNLQKIIPNPTDKTIPSLYDLANATIGTTLENKKRKKKGEKMTEEEEDLIFGWGNVPLSYEQVYYAALDARLGFEIARRHWSLDGYNSLIDRLNV